MSYIDLINQFWKVNKECNFTPNEKALYFALLNTANSVGWKQQFNQSNAYLAIEAGVTEPTLIKARYMLKEKGLIDFKSSSGRRNNTEYQIKYLNIFSISDSISDSISRENILDNIRYKDKTIQENIISSSKDGENKSKIKKTEINDIPIWKTDFNIYLEDLRSAYSSAIEDENFIKMCQKYKPKLDILLTIEKSCTFFWATEEGWEWKKADKKTKKINWRTTLRNSLDNKKNWVWKDERD